MFSVLIIIIIIPTQPPPGHLSLLSSVGLEMSTGLSVAMLCGWGVKAGWLIPHADKHGWHTVSSLVNTCQPERFTDEYRTHDKALYKCSVYFSTCLNRALCLWRHWRLGEPCRSQTMPRFVRNRTTTRMWANAQPDGRPAEHRWRPLFNAAKFS